MIALGLLGVWATGLAFGCKQQQAPGPVAVGPTEPATPLPSDAVTVSLPLVGVELQLFKGCYHVKSMDQRHGAPGPALRSSQVWCGLDPERPQSVLVVAQGDGPAPDAGPPLEQWASQQAARLLSSAAKRHVGQGAFDRCAQVQVNGHNTYRCLGTWRGTLVGDGGAMAFHALSLGGHAQIVLLIHRGATPKAQAHAAMVVQHLEAL